MLKKNIGALALALAPLSLMAGEMGPVMHPTKLLFLEAGASYTHALYKGSVTTAESRSADFPSGFAIDPSDYYPNNHFGGYIGASFYASDWLVNTRFDMFEKKRKANRSAGFWMDLAPTHLSFTIDRVMGDINAASFGLGAGVVVENVNQGETRVSDPVTAYGSETVSGKTRMDPLVEAFAMYRFVDGLGVKLNAAYQIPTNDRFTHGGVNVNLGVNYAFPL